MNNGKLSETLKDSGFSLTKTRQLVFEALSRTESQTIGELTKRLAGKADRASIYRTIALYEKLGIVMRLQAGWKYKLELSNDFSTHHHHLTCMECGRDVPIHENSALEHNIQTFLRAHGFSNESHQVEIRGLCQSCQTRRTP